MGVAICSHACMLLSRRMFPIGGPTSRHLVARRFSRRSGVASAISNGYDSPMWKNSGLAATFAVVTGLLVNLDCAGQTPEQTQAWEAQRVQALAEEKARADQLAAERAARKKDPMYWVRTLNPLAGGGWEFRSVADDGSWATYTTTHQMKRSGKSVTLWLRQEYAEVQVGSDGRYRSYVRKVDYDCSKQRSRTLTVIYYGDNNLEGGNQTEENDPKTAPWDAIVPGTREESNFLWACDKSH